MSKVSKLKELIEAAWNSLDEDRKTRMREDIRDIIYSLKVTFGITSITCIYLLLCYWGILPYIEFVPIVACAIMFVLIIINISKHIIRDLSELFGW